MSSPRLLITMGDVAGVGPEIIAKGWAELASRGRPIVVGDPIWLRRGLDLANVRADVQMIRSPEEARPAAGVVPCLRAGTADLSRVRTGEVSADAGRAAYDFLCAAIDLTMAGRADAIVTAPLHKEGLKAAGLKYPGHTEILAERTGTREFAMVLWTQGPALPEGLGVIHVTLHMALRDVFGHLTVQALRDKILLLD